MGPTLRKKQSGVDVANFFVCALHSVRQYFRLTNIMLKRAFANLIFFACPFCTMFG